MAESDVQAFIQQALEAQQQKLEAAFQREIAAIPNLLIDMIAEAQKEGGKLRPAGPESISDGRFSCDDMINALLVGDVGNRVMVTPSGVEIMSSQPPPQVKEGVSGNEGVQGKKGLGGDLIDTPREEQDNAQEETALAPPPDLKTASHTLSFEVPLRGKMEFSINLPEGGLRGWCEKLATRDGFRSFVEGDIFNAISSSVILANTIYMGHEASTKMHNEIARLYDQQDDFLSAAPEYIFTLFFVCELLMRIVAQRRDFIVGRDVYWNFFDTVLIVISFINLAGNAANNLSIFRIFRIFRLVRLLKVIRRVDLLEGLNLMVSEIIGCVMPLIWAILLLVLIMYAFGVFFVSVVVGYVADISNTEFSTNEGVRTRVIALDDKFGSMYKAVAVLFEGVSGGNDWANLALELKEINEAYYVCFALYIVFVTLGVLNIVTGFFVDGTMQASLSTRSEMLHEAQAKKTEQIQLIGELFEQLDTDQSGTLSLQEFEACMSNDALMEYFCVLGMEPADALELFILIDTKENTGQINISDFTQGCMRVVGTPKNLDIFTLLTQGQKIINLLEKGVLGGNLCNVMEPGALLLV